MAEILATLGKVGVSNWIALGALVVAAIALWRGERRATSQRRRDGDRNIVKWSVSWPSIDGFVVTCLGPDEARDVWVQISAEYGTGEASAARMARGDELLVPMPHLAATWQTTNWMDEGKDRVRVNVLTYGGEISWKSRHGVLGHIYLDSSIQTHREIRGGIVL